MSHGTAIIIGVWHLWLHASISLIPLFASILFILATFYSGSILQSWFQARDSGLVEDIMMVKPSFREALVALYANVCNEV